VPGPTPEQDNPRYVLATFSDYGQAQKAVDTLSDKRFPVEHLTIVGLGLKTVENVLGRLSWGRAAVSGLAMGAWFGVLIGLFVSLFANGEGGILALVLLGLRRSGSSSVWCPMRSPAVVVISSREANLSLTPTK